MGFLYKDLFLVHILSLLKKNTVEKRFAIEHLISIYNSLYFKK